jgi:hypothetical protein
MGPTPEKIVVSFGSTGHTKKYGDSFLGWRKGSVRSWSVAVAS